MQGTFLNIGYLVKERVKEFYRPEYSFVGSLSSEYAGFPDDWFMNPDINDFECVSSVAHLPRLDPARSCLLRIEMYSVYWCFKERVVVPFPARFIPEVVACRGTERFLGYDLIEFPPPLIDVPLRGFFSMVMVISPLFDSSLIPGAKLNTYGLVDELSEALGPLKDYPFLHQNQRTVVRIFEVDLAAEAGVAD